MKINGSELPVEATLSESLAREQQQENSEVARQDRLEFSTTSRRLETEFSQETPEERVFRVNRLAQEVNSGTYNMKAERVADAMLRGAILSTDA